MEPDYRRKGPPENRHLLLYATAVHTDGVVDVHRPHVHTCSRPRNQVTSFHYSMLPSNTIHTRCTSIFTAVARTPPAHEAVQQYCTSWHVRSMILVDGHLSAVPSRPAGSRVKRKRMDTAVKKRLVAQ